MRKRFLLLGMLALACSSCVEFEQQDVWFRYDEKADTLRMFTVYGGLFNGADLDDPSEYLDEAMRELVPVMAGRRAYFFNNLLEYSAEFLRYQSSNVADAADRSLAQLLLDNVSIKSGKFFLNAEGKLCNYQFLEVKNASKLVKAINAFFNRKCVKGGPPRELSKASGKLWLKAAAADHQWLTLDGGAVMVRIPLTEEDFLKFKRDVGKDVGEKSLGSAAWKLKRIASIVASDWWVTWKDGFAVFNIGFSGQDVNHLGMAVDNSEMGHSIIEPVKKEYGLLGKAPDINALSRNFLKSGVIPESAITPPVVPNNAEAYFKQRNRSVRQGELG